MVRALLAIGVLQIITMIVQLVRTKALALLLGPEQIGIMAVVDKLVAVIVQIASLSLPFAALRFLPAVWTDDTRGFRTLVTRMRNVLLVTTSVAALGALLLTAAWPHLAGRQLAGQSRVVSMALVCIPVLAFVPFWQNAMAGRLAQNRAMLVALGQALVMTLAVLGVVWGGLAGYYAAYAVAGTGLVILAGRRVLADVPAKVRGDAGFSIRLPRPVWRFSAALMVVTFATPYAALFVHYHVLGARGAQAAGWMQAAIGIGLAVRAVLGSAHAVFLTPNVNRGDSPAERMAWANRFQTALGLLGAVVLPPLLLFPDLAIRVLYSRAFLPGAAFVWLFVLVEVLTLIGGTYQAIVIAVDELGFHVAQTVAATLVVILCGARFIGEFGILGAGLAAATGPLLIITATTGFLRWRHALAVSPRALTITFVMLAALGGAGWMGVHLEGAAAATLVPKAGLYGLVLALVAAMLTPAERASLLQTLDRARRRPSRSRDRTT